MHAPRIATETEFPYGWPGGRVCYIHLADDGTISQLHTRDDMRSYLSEPTGRLFAAWPGQYRTDLFAIEPAFMAAQMGIHA